jgi:drug/metabolite transporter (DMT)-like permease
VNAIFGGAVLIAALFASAFWIAAVSQVAPKIHLPAQRATWFTTAGSFLLINLTLVLIFVADTGSSAIMAVFGLAMGLQLVASISAFLFARSRRVSR